MYVPIESTFLFTKEGMMYFIPNINIEKQKYGTRILRTLLIIFLCPCAVVLANKKPDNRKKQGI